MNIPSLPTDNLYKFVALSGVAIFLFALYFTLSSAKSFDKQAIVLSGEIAKLQQDSTNLANDRRNLKSEIRGFYEASGLKAPLIVSDTLIVYSRLLSASPNLQKKSDEIERLVDEYNGKWREYESQNIELQTKQSLQKYNQDLTRAMFISCPILIVFGALLAMVGFVNWYNKVQGYQDLLLETEVSLKGEDHRRCQSCAIRISDDPEGGGTEKDGRKSKYYCSACYRNGEFSEPNLTLKEMRKKVKGRLIELKVPFFTRQRYLNTLSSLNRWNRRLKW